MKILKRLIASIGSRYITEDAITDTFRYSEGYEDVRDIFHKYLKD